LIEGPAIIDGWLTAADYASNPNATPADLGNFYRWRVLAERQFNP
jgi:hypothetical protein